MLCSLLEWSAHFFKNPTGKPVTMKRKMWSHDRPCFRSSIPWYEYTEDVVISLLKRHPLFKRITIKIWFETFSKFLLCFQFNIQIAHDWIESIFIYDYNILVFNNKCLFDIWSGVTSVMSGIREAKVLNQFLSTSNLLLDVQVRHEFTPLFRTCPRYCLWYILSRSDGCFTLSRILPAKI